MLSPPNFSRKASARTMASMASPTTPAAGTAQTSLRSTTASTASFVARSTDLSGVRRVERGFIAARTTTGCPFLTPPSRPPRLFGLRLNPLSASQRNSSWTAGARGGAPDRDEPPLRRARARHARGRLARARALEDVPDVVVAVLHGAGGVGVARPWSRDLLLRGAGLGWADGHR